MERIARNVRDLREEERRVYEAALGEKLRENQQVILQVITVAPGEQVPESASGAQPAGELPDWCHVYEGLTDEEVEELEKLILDRSGWTRNLQ